jgi:uncharacterized protein (TIGR04222 family)
VALVVACVLGVATRGLALRSRRDREGTELHPVEVAYLQGGPKHAVLVAGLGLHRAGRLRPGPVRNPKDDASRVRLTREQVLQQAPTTCVVVGDAGDRHPLEQAVVRTVRGLATKRVALDPALTTGPEVDGIRERLGRLGLVVDGRLARRMRLAGLWPAAVGAFGVVRLAASPGDGAGVLALLTGTAFLAAASALRVPDETPAAEAAVAAARADVQDPERVQVLLRRVASAGYGTDDPAKVRLGTDPAVVAAYGPEVLWSADPLLGAALGSAPPPRLSRPPRMELGDTPTATGYA